MPARPHPPYPSHPDLSRARRLPGHSLSEASTQGIAFAGLQVVVSAGQVYDSLKRFGGAREDRTPDLLRARQALSQLSYGPSIACK